MKVAITGPNGFLGQHVRFALFPFEKEFSIVLLDRSFFIENEVSKLEEELSECDRIIHLAGMSRGTDDEVYRVNVSLARTIVNVCEKLGAKPSIVFASSTQIRSNTAYGKSKKEAMEIFRAWSKHSGAMVSNLVIPGAFGEFGKPFYNSVVSTFCYQLLRDEKPHVNQSGIVTLVHAQEVAKHILILLREPRNEDILVSGREISVPEVYNTLLRFKRDYLDNIIPKMKDSFECALFNTFRSYLPDNFYPRYLDLKIDARGTLFEAVKERSGGQTFLSSSKPGVTRGGHYHTRKIERLCVIGGMGRVRLRKLFSNEIKAFVLDANRPSFIEIPTFYTHDITNIGRGDLLTLFWANEIFNPEDSDSYSELVSPT
jgi:UDP-2-acetamido-2,6-beta-L-arabino-hexul-4-ose reductase